MVERREDGRRGWMYCGRTEADVNIMTIAALTENTPYFFRVYAENKFGRSEPLESEFGLVPKRIFGKYSCCVFLLMVWELVSLGESVCFDLIIGWGGVGGVFCHKPNRLC